MQAGSGVVAELRSGQESNGSFSAAQPPRLAPASSLALAVPSVDRLWPLFTLRPLTAHPATSASANTKFCRVTPAQRPTHHAGTLSTDLPSNPTTVHTGPGTATHSRRRLLYSTGMENRSQKRGFRVHG
ncbi:hypothetical protein MHYP_G00326890 [Metynnis hypsauchen]